MRRASAAPRGRGSEREQFDWDEVAVGALVAAWRWRLELALLAAVVGAQRLLAAVVGELGAVGTLGALLAVAVVVAPARRLLWRGLRRTWLRRAWEHAANDTELSTGRLGAPAHGDRGAHSGG